MVILPFLSPILKCSVVPMTDEIYSSSSWRDDNIAHTSMWKCQSFIWHTELGSNIAHSDARQRQMSGRVTKRNHKEMRTLDAVYLLTVGMKNPTLHSFRLSRNSDRWQNMFFCSQQLENTRDYRDQRSVPCSLHSCAVAPWLQRSWRSCRDRPAT